jgi:hypothetical protein
MRFWILILVLFSPLAHADELPAAAETNTESAAPGKVWFRNAGEWLSTRTVRQGIATDATTKLITNGKRFDVTIGKRIPLFNWKEKSLSSVLTLGIDGGMMASLNRFKQGNNPAFATETFDGFFGAFIGYTEGGNVFLLRTAHLSAHLVDNSPLIGIGSQYNQFWTEVIVGQNFPAPEEEADWDLYFQISAGRNYRSIPAPNGVRTQAGVSVGKCLSGLNSLAVLASADLLRQGASRQDPHYSAFLGLGYLNRPNSTHRPLRFGFSWQGGSDHRNQLHSRKSRFMGLEIQTEF